MLNKKENSVMKVILDCCKNKNSLLITPKDIIDLSHYENLSFEEVEKIMKDLSSDRYFDLVYSDRQGELVYCVALKEKGISFERDKKMTKRNLVYRLCLTVIFAVISFVIGLILKAIF